MSTDHELVEKARGGDRAALESLVRRAKDLVYNLAVRMLGSHADAEDASQEVLIRIVTGLGGFRGDSTFRTWVFRVASNHLLTARKRQAEDKTESFEAMAGYLEAGLAANLPPLDDAVLVTEAKLACTSKMLLCLDRDQRIAFILGEVLELPSDEAADVLELTPDAFRKRLSRARERMGAFMLARCGLVDAGRPCRCATQAAGAQARGILDPARLSWTRAATVPEISGARRIEDLERLERAAAVFRGHPSYVAPESLILGLRRVLQAGRSDLLD